ncbi:hypothetical protein M5D96_009253, partial [Drosophila gunungcola]
MWSGKWKVSFVQWTAHMLCHCRAKVELSSMCDPFRRRFFGFHWLF